MKDFNIYNWTMEYLVEGDEKEDKENDSLDVQVDRYLISFEDQARGIVSEGRIISEADEDEDVDEEPALEDEAMPNELSLDDLDIEKFTTSVVRLVKNASRMLEFHSTILRRAENYLSRTYDEQTIDEFKQMLLNVHGMSSEKSSKEVEAEKTQDYFSSEAGPYQ